MSAGMSWFQFISHVFESDAVVKPLCPLADWSRGCCFWAPAPFLFVFGLVFGFVCRVLWRNASLAGGFAGRRVLVVLCVLLPLWFDLPAHLDQLCPLYKLLFTAYAHVRTEPQSDIGQTRGKKITGLRTGPLPVLLWLSTSRQPCMIITIHLFAAIERV